MVQGQLLGANNMHIILMKEGDMLHNVENMNLLHTTLVLRSNPSTNFVKIYLYNPYKASEKLLDIWKPGRGTFNKAHNNITVYAQFFAIGLLLNEPQLDNIPYVHANLEGHRLKVAHAADYGELLMPYFYFESANPAATFSGVDMSIMNYLARSLNFTFSMHVSIDRQWGSPVPGSNNSWTGMIGMVQRQVV